LEQVYGQGLESHLRNAAQVSAHTHQYVSKRAFEQFEYHQIESRKYLERTYIESQLGDLLSLAEVSDSTVSNPRIRRMEMMTRIRGMEEYASAHGYECLFITLTLPSRFHACHKKGFRNNKFDGSSPKDGNGHLMKLWSHIRSKFSRTNLKPFGIRVVEPHHDGTPHWHMLLFVTPAQKPVLVEIFNAYVKADLEQGGSLKHRLDVTYIDPERGSAAGYIAKYVSKNIDGEGLTTDKTGAPLRNAPAPARTRAWASLWKIRQFQFMGAPPVGVWRELRRMKIATGLIEKARQAADLGDWCAYTEAMLEPQLCGDRLGVELMKAHTSTVNKITGEYTTSERNAYGEPAPGKVVGVKSGILRQTTRMIHWLGKHYEPLTLIGIVRVAHNPSSGSGSTAAVGSALGLV
jgi:hypothetical protein